MLMEIKAYVNSDGNKVERLIPVDQSGDKFFGVAQAVNNGTPFEVRFPIEAADIDGAMSAFDGALSVFIQNVEAARAQAQAAKDSKSDAGNASDSSPKLVLNNG